MSINLNIGILGHVDAGKTSIAKLLSNTPSTACFDKNPQSRERGITLDLGISSFALMKWVITLVDCPGHASLFRTVIGAGQLLDGVILVIDAVHGIQTQTAECLVLLEALEIKTILVLINKTDLLQDRPEVLPKNIERVRKTIQKNISCKSVTFLPVSALEPNCRNQIISALEELFESKSCKNLPKDQASLLLAIDHCFAVKGQGTILTGIILRGNLSLNDEIEIAMESLTSTSIKRVKSIQVFRKTVSTASIGDRVGVCVQGLDPKSVERTLAFTPGKLQRSEAIVMPVRLVKQYKGGRLHSKMKLHVSILHETIMADAIIFFKKNGLQYVEEVIPVEADELMCIVLCKGGLLAPVGFKAVASKLDIDGGRQCRLVFSGTIHEAFNSAKEAREAYPLIRWKVRNAHVDRIINDQRWIGSGLVRKNGGSLEKFIGKNLLIYRSSDPGIPVGEGKIESHFGTTGKFNIYLSKPLETRDVRALNLVLQYKKLIQY